MINIKNEVKKLYKDAMYFHLINSGYSSYRAEFMVERLFSNRMNIIG